MSIKSWISLKICSMPPISFRLILVGGERSVFCFLLGPSLPVVRSRFLLFMVTDISVGAVSLVSSAGTRSKLIFDLGGSDMGVSTLVGICCFDVTQVSMILRFAEL